MVNFGLNSASILGIFLAVAGASLYFLRSVRPELSRDHDIFFAAVGLLCGFILLFQGWRLDPILQFGQFLLTGSAIFFAVESIRLRGVATEQARRNTPIVDRDRPVSRTRVYREEDIDRIEESYGYENATPNYDSPRLRGYDDPEVPTPRRNSVTRDSRTPRNRPQRYTSTETPRSPRSPQTPPPSRPPYDEWQREDDWDQPKSTPPRNPRTESDRNLENYSRPNTRKKRPNPEDLGKSYDNQDWTKNYDDGLGRSYDEGLGTSYDDEPEIPTDYVDYQPLDNTDSDYPPENEDRVDQERYRSRESTPERRNPNSRPDLDY